MNELTLAWKVGLTGLAGLLCLAGITGLKAGFSWWIDRSDKCLVATCLWTVACLAILLAVGFIWLTTEAFKMLWFS
jgi:hypothetical protein